MKLRRAVTLIELMIVMIIVAILSVVIFVSMTGAIDESEQAAIEDYKAHIDTVLKQHVTRLVSRAKGKDDFLAGGIVRAECSLSSRGLDDSLGLTTWYANIPGAANFMPDPPIAPYIDSLYIYVPNNEAAMRCLKVGTYP